MAGHGAGGGDKASSAAMPSLDFHGATRLTVISEFWYFDFSVISRFLRLQEPLERSETQEKAEPPTWKCESNSRTDRLGGQVLTLGPELENKGEVSR